MMRLIKEDLQMLPEWIRQGSRTLSFFQWLMEETQIPWECEGCFVVKVMQKNSYFLYSCKNKGRMLGIGKNLEFAGIFHRSDYGLYDLKEPLRKLLKIPDAVHIPCKEETLKEAEVIANRRAFQLLGRDWTEVLKVSDCKKEELLPKIVRREIINLAEKYYRAGKTESEICFMPKVPVATYFSDQCYLLYLSKKEQVAERIAWQWVRENTAYLSRQRIWYGCVRDEFRELKKQKNKI